MTRSAVFVHQFYYCNKPNDATQSKLGVKFNAASFHSTAAAVFLRAAVTMDSAIVQVTWSCGTDKRLLYARIQLRIRKEEWSSTEIIARPLPPHYTANPDAPQPSPDGSPLAVRKSPQPRRCHRFIYATDELSAKHAINMSIIISVATSIIRI